MATPTIEAISTQEITIDTDYELEIGITNDPEEVTVEGLWVGWYYDWDAATDTLTIKGNARRLAMEAFWTVIAKETAASTPVTRDISYNVIHAAPIITLPDDLEFGRGFNYDDFPEEIEIANEPIIARVEGSQVGLVFVPSENGIQITGQIPDDFDELTTGIIEIFSENTGGMDTEIGTFVISDRAGIITTDGSTTLVNYGVASGIATELLSLSVSDILNVGHILCMSRHDDEVFVLHSDTSLHQRQRRVRSYRIDYGNETISEVRNYAIEHPDHIGGISDRFQGLAIDSDGNGYAVSGGGDYVFRFNALSNTDSIVTLLDDYFSLPSTILDITNRVVGADIDASGNLYVATTNNVSGGVINIFVVPANTAHLGTATITRQFTTSSILQYQKTGDIALRRNVLYIVGDTGSSFFTNRDTISTIRTVDANTANGTIAAFDVDLEIADTDGANGVTY